MFLKSKFLLRGAANHTGAAAIARHTILKPIGLSGTPLAISQQTSNLFTYPFFNKFGFATRRGSNTSGAAPEVINEASIDDSIRVETVDDCNL
jgi:hypothetical protein